jgi:hypothetical protein
MTSIITANCEYFMDMGIIMQTEGEKGEKQEPVLVDTLQPI